MKTAIGKTTTRSFLICNEVTVLFTLALAILLSPIAQALNFESHQVNEVNYITLSGVMSDQKSKSNEFIELVNLDHVLNTAYQQNNPLVILFSSEGGSREIAIPMASQIIQFSKLWRERTGVPVLFAVTGECSSACTFLTSHLANFHDPKTLMFMVPRETLFYFHAPVILYGERYTRRAQENWRNEVRLGLQQYLSSGVNPDWMKRNRFFFVNSVAQSVSASELCHSDSRIIPRSSCVLNYLNIEQHAESVVAQVKFNTSLFGLLLKPFRPQ
jgi:hypothetical protein